ncbi:MAG TPA: patatin-like phospholipase family protein [Anaerolineales bacterium]|nr:patatin-like phospholipase family protein [Anaerolineales bacterium]
MAVQGLVLAGGGGRGAYQAGAYKALYEYGLRPSVIVGTSIGAINGAMIVSGHHPNSLIREWRSMSSSRVHRLRRDIWRFARWTGVYNTDPWAKTLEQQIDIQKVRESPVQLRVTATEFRTGKLRVFENSEITIPHILASCSIPVVYPWTMVNGEHYWDGAVMAEAPLFPAIRAGANEIWVILLSPVGAHPMPVPRNLLEGAALAFELALMASFENYLAQLHRINKDVLAGKNTTQTYVDCTVVAPSQAIPIDWIMRYDKAQIDFLIDLGYRDTWRAIRKRIRERAGQNAGDMPDRNDYTEYIA